MDCMSFQASNKYIRKGKSPFAYGLGILKNMNLYRICIQCKKSFGNHKGLECPEKL